MEDRNILYSLIDDPTSVLKISDKGFVEVVWDRVNYLKKVYKQREDGEKEEKIPSDFNLLDNAAMKAL